MPDNVANSGRINTRPDNVVGTSGWPTDRYLARMLALLAAATFFQGYDNQLISVLLPNLQSQFGAGEARLGALRMAIDLGLVAAFFVGRLADRFGRRPILLVSILGYTMMTGLTAISWNIWSFAGFQFGARVFLGAEYAIGVTLVVEEFASERRGRALGILLGCSALGTVAVGLLMGAGLLHSSLGWRSFYLIGLIPLILLIYGRRRIRESRRFVEVSAQQGAAGAGVFAPWARPHRRNLMLMGLVYLLIAIPQFGAFGWLAFHAERELNFTSDDVALFILAGYGPGCSGFLVCGWAMERFGRKPTLLVYGAGAMVWLVILFQVSTKPIALVATFFAIFCTLGILPVLSALAAELFPTQIRSSALVWIRNVFETIGLASGPALVGVLADHRTGPIGDVGDSVTLLCALFIPALWIVWRQLPDTGGQLTETTHDRVDAVNDYHVAIQGNHRSTA